MFGTSMSSRKGRAEQVAEEAWEHLLATVTAAGDTARSATRSSTRLADTVGNRMSSAADEALYRANRALDALAGRRPGLPWSWIAGAALVGLAVGWAASTASRAALSRVESTADTGRTTNQVEFVDVDKPSNPVSLDR